MNCPKSDLQSSRALEGLVDVSRETRGRLETYVALLRRWQPVQNLVSRNTLESVWTRHIADSAQLLPLYGEYASNAKRWVDLGTGAGLPGLIVAILLEDLEADCCVYLVESNQRKIAFLRFVVRELNLNNTTLIAKRIEAVADGPDRQTFDVVTARAVANLNQLLNYAAPLLAPKGVCFFHKGREVARDLDEASRNFRLSVIETTSKVASDSTLLIVCGIERRQPEH